MMFMLLLMMKRFKGLKIELKLLETQLYVGLLKCMLTIRLPHSEP